MWVRRTWGGSARVVLSGREREGDVIKRMRGLTLGRWVAEKRWHLVQPLESLMQPHLHQSRER